MRKEMHWSLTAGALLALAVHHPALLLPVVAEVSPVAQEVLLSVARIRVAERSE
jgi:hypothetical protein